MGGLKGKGEGEGGCARGGECDEGVDVVRRNPEVVKAMAERGLDVHGVVYDVGTGELRELEVGEGEEGVRKRVESFKVG